jgi:hypothetical protein
VKYLLGSSSREREFSFRIATMTSVADPDLLNPDPDLPFSSEFGVRVLMTEN